MATSGNPPKLPAPQSQTASESNATVAAPLRAVHYGHARIIFLYVLLAVLAGCLVFAWTTRDAMANLPFLSPMGQQPNTGSGQKSVVDIGPWQTAEALAPLAVSAEETNFAAEALRLSDHEVDQAFAYALRKPSSLLSAGGKPSPEVKDLTDKVEQLNQQIKDDQAQIKTLTPNGTAPVPDSAEADSLDILKAQLSLDNDVLNDAQDQLARATGDQRPQIQQELSAHQATQAKLSAKTAKDGEVAVVAVQRHTTLAGRMQSWVAQNNRRKLLLQAKDKAWSDTAALEKEYNTLEAQAGRVSQAPTQVSTNQASANKAAWNPAGGNVDHSTRLAALKQQGLIRQLINIENDRIHTEKQLADIYDKWAAQVELQHRIVLHLILQSIALIAFILICVTIATSLIHRWMDRPGLDPRRAITLRTIFQLAVQALGFVMVMLVVFGVPKQVSTVIGLATAGITVALQDFIIAFLGWFFLMGRNGIRLGDSVEINGVTGEVIELGLFRTTILETGNSTEEGHPTGRRVAILNKFAVNGQYFNFSSASQWMWDEITISVPESKESYAAIEQIHRAILKETDKDAQQAEQEWQRSSRFNGLSQFGAAAQVNLRPANPGINVLVRYVTRAADRFDRRNRLYQTVIDVLHENSPQPELTK